MDAAVIAAIAVLILVTLWFILRPLWQPSSIQMADPALTHHLPLAELIHRRDAVYTAIKDLELDLAGDKVSQEDYTRLRAKLTNQAATILKQIDQLSRTTDQELEVEIDSLLGQFGTEASLNQLRAQARAEIKADLNHASASSDGPQFHCPNCRQTVQSDDAFCSQCGTPLESRCAECGTLADVGDKFCAQCGAQLLAEAAK